VTAPSVRNFLGFELRWSKSRILSLLALEMNFGGDRLAVDRTFIVANFCGEFLSSIGKFRFFEIFSSEVLTDRIVLFFSTSLIFPSQTSIPRYIGCNICALSN
jgi:hypothetical protein